MIKMNKKVFYGQIFMSTCKLILGLFFGVFIISTISRIGVASTIVISHLLVFVFGFSIIWYALSLIFNYYLQKLHFIQ